MSTPLLRCSDIAWLYGVRPSAVSNWRVRLPHFPQPVYTSGEGYGAVHLFDPDTIDAWMRQYRYELWCKAHLCYITPPTLMPAAPFISNTISTYDDPLHLRTDSNCDWCDAPWEPHPSGGYLMIHTDDCSYYEWCEQQIIDDMEDHNDIAGILGDDVVLF